MVHKLDLKQTFFKHEYCGINLYSHFFIKIYYYIYFKAIILLNYIPNQLVIFFLVVRNYIRKLIFKLSWNGVLWNIWFCRCPWSAWRSYLVDWTPRTIRMTYACSSFPIKIPTLPPHRPPIPTAVLFPITSTTFQESSTFVESTAPPSSQSVNGTPLLTHFIPQYFIS